MQRMTSETTFRWAFLILLATLLALLTANWIFTAVAALSIAGTLARIPKEEQMMLKAFGDEYRVYMRHTGRFIPKSSNP